MCIRDRFNLQVDIIGRQLESLSKLPDAKRGEILDDTKRKLTDAENKMKQMESEFASASSQNQTVFKAKLRRCRVALDERRKKLFENEDRYLSQNITAGRSNTTNLDANVRDRAENNAYKAFDQDDKWKKINRTAAETEDLGVTIQGNLRKQRDVIINTTNMTKEIDSELKKTNQIMSTMSRREMIKVGLLYLLVVLLTITDLIVALKRLHLI
eukprot:TRINITY_DN10792_c0_g1_i1.p1 TRINITY_DN10792_c0_g1~~TRINITY_DN10792_c0_g1_i1.p1  ORF type:complete len:213 (+),score=60.31 TRINITY_DN10792_c0_g1_i1:64-702(+)